MDALSAEKDAVRTQYEALKTEYFDLLDGIMEGSVPRENSVELLDDLLKRVEAAVAQARGLLDFATQDSGYIAQGLQELENSL